MQDVERALSNARAQNPYEPFTDENGIWNEGFSDAWATVRAALAELRPDEELQGARERLTTALESTIEGVVEVGADDLRAILASGRPDSSVELREALRDIIGNANEAMPMGPFDCIDNHGEPYQSEAFHKALERGRKLLAALSGRAE